MTLQQHYHNALHAKGFSPDPAQLEIIALLQHIADQLSSSSPTHAQSTSNNAPKSNWLQRLFTQDKTQTAAKWIKGLYCYGGVGRGKTFIMDLFYDYLPTTRKKRLHFHRFMLEIHHALGNYPNTADPLAHVVQALKQQIDIVLLDECFVSDITDAMLLSKLFEHMEKQGVTLVTTSNLAPDELYRNGLQRDRFLPAIAWLNSRLTVHAMPDGEDYRARFLQKAEIFRQPDTPANRQALLEDLAQLSDVALQPLAKAQAPFVLGSRKIDTYYQDNRFIVFDFNILCAGNHSQKDYIEIAKLFAYVGIVNIYQMDSSKEDVAKRFLLLIDEFYDRQVKLLSTMATSADALYQGRKLIFEYQRLQSRLGEMQSKEYWQLPHRP